MYYVDILRKIVGLSTLETRRLQRDLILQDFQGFEKIDKNIIFKFSSTALRDDKEKLYHRGCRLNCRY